MQPERHARVRRVEQRALALDEEHARRRARTPSSDELLGRAGDEVGDDGVDGDPPAGDRDPGLAGRDELARGCPRASPRASSSSATVIFPIAQSEPTVRTSVAPCVEVLARRHVEAGRRLAQVAQLDAVPAASRQLGVARRGTRAGRSRRRARRGCTLRAARATRAGTARPASRRRRAPSSARTAARRRPCRRPGSPRARLPRPLASRARDDVLAAVADDAARRSCRSAGRRSGPRRGRAAYAGATPSPGRSDGQLHTVDELDTGPRVVGEQQVAVEIDVVA